MSQGDTPCGERRDDSRSQIPDPRSQIPDSRFTLQTPIAELQAERGFLPGAFLARVALASASCSGRPSSWRRGLLIGLSRRLAAVRAHPPSLRSASRAGVVRIHPVSRLRSPFT